MGFLADVGGSGGVGQLGQNFLTGALQAGQFVQNAETQRLAQQKAQMEIQQAEKDNKEYHIDAALSMYPEEERPFVKEVLVSAGKIRPDGIVVGKDMREVPKLFEQYPKVAIGRGTMEFEKLAKENEKLAKKGDPQSQQQMIANAQRMTEIKKGIMFLSGKDKEEELKSFDPTHDVYKGSTLIRPGIPKIDMGSVYGESERGDLFYQSKKGLVDATGRLYDPQADGKINKAIETPSTKSYTMDRPDPTGKKWPGGTIWEKGIGGNLEYLGPAKDPTAVARVNIDMGKLSDKGLKTMVDNYMVDGKIPSFGFSAVGASQRRAFYDAVAARREETGDTAGAQAARASGLKADTTSLSNAQKIYDMMDSYTRNMDAQIDRMEEIMKDISRYDTRLMNVPLRKWKMTVAGSPVESKVGMYVTEISNEIGKLSTGSAASVQELSQTAQQKWDKIHDPNLSPKDLLSLLKETKHAGRLRMDTANDVIQSIKGRIGGTGGGGGKDPLGLGL